VGWAGIDKVADETVGGAKFHVAGTLTSIDQDGADGRIERVGNINLAETEFLLEFIAGLFRQAARGTGGNHLRLDQGFLDRVPAAMMRTPSGVHRRDLGGLHQQGIDAEGIQFG